jgi:hypothetical protein
MKTRTNKYGGHECDECGELVTIDGLTVDTHKCEASNILFESVRKGVARGIAHRLTAENITANALEEMREWLTVNGYAIVTPSLEIVEGF